MVVWSAAPYEHLPEVMNITRPTSTGSKAGSLLHTDGNGRLRRTGERAQLPGLSSTQHAARLVGTRSALRALPEADRPEPSRCRAFVTDMDSVDRRNGAAGEHGPETDYGTAGLTLRRRISLLASAWFRNLCPAGRRIRTCCTRAFVTIRDVLNSSSFAAGSYHHNPPTAVHEVSSPWFLSSTGTARSRRHSPCRPSPFFRSRRSRWRGLRGAAFPGPSGSSLRHLRSVRVDQGLADDRRHPSVVDRALPDARELRDAGDCRRECARPQRLCCRPMLQVHDDAAPRSSWGRTTRSIRADTPGNRPGPETRILIRSRPPAAIRRTHSRVVFLAGKARGRSRR